MISYKLLELAY